MTRDLSEAAVQAPGWLMADALCASARMSPDGELSYLATSASIIEIGMGGIRLTLSEGSKCVRAQARNGARKEALKLAQTARDRLNTLIYALEGEAQP